MLESPRKNAGRRPISVGSVRRLAPEIALVDGRSTQKGQAGDTHREMGTTVPLSMDRTAGGLPRSATDGPRLGACDVGQLGSETLEAVYLELIVSFRRTPLS
jgi:hypothetical protein